MVDKLTGIWTIEEAKKRHRFDASLANSIMHLFMPKSIADLGCGNGSYCKFFKDHSGCDIVHGYEGTKEITKLGFFNDIFFLDLTKKRYSDLYYDLIISLEVGEHIPANFEQTYIDNVCEFTKNDLVISWAVPKQGGLGHFNEKPNEYVIEEFTKRGVIYNSDYTGSLRKSSSLRWFKNTVMVFHRRGNGN